MALRLISEKLLVANKFHFSPPSGWSRGSNSSHIASVTGNAAYLVGTQYGINPPQDKFSFRKFTDEGIPQCLHTEQFEPIEIGGSDRVNPLGPGAIAALPNGRFVYARIYYTKDPVAFPPSPSNVPFIEVRLYSSNGSIITTSSIFSSNIVTASRLTKIAVDPTSSRFTVITTGSRINKGYYFATFDYNLALVSDEDGPGNFFAGHSGMRPTFSFCRVDVDIPLYEFAIRYKIGPSGSDVAAGSPIANEMTHLHFQRADGGGTSGLSITPAGTEGIFGPSSHLFGEGAANTSRNPPIHSDLMVGPVASVHDASAGKLYMIDQNEASGAISVRLHQWSFSGGGGSYTRGARTTNTIVTPPPVPGDANFPSPQLATNQPGDELVVLPDGKLLIAYPCPYFYLKSNGQPASNNFSRLLIIDPSTGSVVQDISQGYTGDISITSVGNRIYVLSHRVNILNGVGLFENTYLESYWYDSGTQPHLSLDITDSPGSNDPVSIPGTATQYLLSESQATQPSNTSGFSGSAPSGYVAPPPDGLKKVYAWFEKNSTISFLPNFREYTATGTGTAFSNSILLSDRTSGNQAVTNEQPTSVSFGTPLENIYYFLSETQTTPPSPSDPNFQFVVGPLSETLFSLSASQGSHNVYLWLKTSGTVNPSAITDSIVLDNTNSAIFTLSLADQTSGSTTTTDDSTVNCDIQINVPALNKYVLSESSTPPNEASPLWLVFPSGSFTVPHTFSDGTDGTKILYLHVKENSSDAIASINDSIQLLNPNNNDPCYGQFQLFHQLKDRTDGDSNVTDERIIDVDIFSSFHSDPGCDLSVVQYILTESPTTPGEFDPRWTCCLADVGTQVKTFFIASPNDGMKTVYFFKKDPAGTVYSATPRVIRLDTGIDANIVFNLKDRTSFSTDYTNETTVIMDLTGSTNGQFDQLSNLTFAWNNTGVPPHPDFFITLYNAFPLEQNVLNPTCDGVKTVFLYVRDPKGNIGTYPDSIILDRHLSIQNLGLTLLDRTSASQDFTNETIVSVSITAAPGTAAFCRSAYNEFSDLKFLLTEDPSPVSETDLRFVFLPDTFTLSSSPGLKTVYLWVKDLAGNMYPTGPVQDSITLVNGVNANITLDVFDRTTGSPALTNEQVISVQIGGSGPEFFALEFFLSEGPFPPAPNDPGWSTTAAVTFLLSPGDGSKNVYLHAKNNDDNTKTVTDSIVLDTFVDIIGLAIFVTDRTSGSPAYTNDEIVSVDIQITGAEANQVVYLLSESFAQPSEFDTRFVVSQPTQFDLSSGDGSKNLRLWVKDAAGNMTFADDSIILDTLFDATLGSVASDRTNGSVTQTDERIISVDTTLSGPESSSLICFLSETQDTTPSEFDSRFSTTIPSTIELSIGSGIKILYLWCKDPAGNIDSTTTTIQLTSGISPNIDISDRVVNDAQITREHVVSISFDADGTNPPVTGWLVSETQGTMPSVSDTRFVTTIPQTFNLKTTLDPVNGEAQVRTVYAWVKDPGSVLHTTPASSTIFLGVPPTGALALADISSGSTTTVRSRIVSTLISANSNVRDGGITGYLISETQNTQPAFGDTRFAVSTPQTFELSPGNGIKSVFLWLKNRYSVSTASATSPGTVFLDAEISFTHILRNGSQLVSPAVSTNPPTRIAKFMFGSSDIAFFVIKGTNLFDFRARADLPINPDTPTAANFQLDGGRAYLYNLVLDAPLTTVTVTGFPLSN